MVFERLRFREHVWYAFEVGLLVCCLYDLGVCQHKLGIGEARGLSTFWSNAGRAATLILVVYFCFQIFAWYRRRALGHKRSRARLFLSSQVLAWLFVLYDSSDFHAIRVHFAIGLGVGFYAFFEMVRAFAAKRLSTKGVHRTDLALFSICAILLGLEILLRTVAMFSTAAILAHSDDTAAETMLRNSPVARKFYYGFPFNDSAHYDTPFGTLKLGQRRVLSIGDSFSTGVVPHYHHFTTVAERALPGVELSNLGIPGLGPFEYLHLLRTEGVPLKPDAVIINVVVGNDFVEAWQRQRERTGQYRTLLESWYTRSSVYLYLVMSRLMSFATEAHRVSSEQKGRGLDWEEGTRIAQQPEELDRAFPWIHEPSVERPTMSDESFFEMEVQHAVEAASREIDNYAPAFFEALERIRAEIGGKPWAVVIIPDGYQIDDALWDRIKAELPRTSFNRFRGQEMIKAWAAEKEIPCLDLVPALRATKSLEDGQRHVFHRNDPHFNTRGNTVVGETLAEFLAKQFAFLTRGG